jgi:L-alanine-DL-glutamate epimerase-like enolase superfamily enzyme
MLFDHHTIAVERWPLRTPFRISRSAKTEAVVVTITLEAGGVSGRGEGCPYARYGDSPETAVADLKAAAALVRDAAELPAARDRLAGLLPPSSARNALDCALWHLEARLTGTPVHDLAGLPPPTPLTTCFTLSLDTPEAMAAAAARHRDQPLLKLKLGDAARDAARIAAVRTARPDARLVADANEGWRFADLPPLLAAAASAGVELIEQPLPASDDYTLREVTPAVPLCADESAAPGSDVTALSDRYQAVNIKLDKTGGLTAALAAIASARAAGCRIMVGSMVSTSLSMAPAALLGPLADWVDLDSPALLARDRDDAMAITGGILAPPPPGLWG